MMSAALLLLASAAAKASASPQSCSCFKCAADSASSWLSLRLRVLALKIIGANQRFISGSKVFPFHAFFRGDIRGNFPTLKFLQWLLK